MENLYKNCDTCAYKQALETILEQLGNVQIAIEIELENRKVTR